MAGLTDRVRRRQTPCADVAVALPAYVAGETGLDARSARHVAQCLRCQAEIVRYRRMLRTLHDLRHDGPRPPASVLADIIGQLGAEDPVQPRLLAIVVVAAGAGAAGGAGMMLWVTRRSRLTQIAQEMANRFWMSRTSTKAITRT